MRRSPIATTLGLAVSLSIAALAGCSGGSAQGTGAEAGSATVAASSADSTSFCDSFCTKNATCDGQVDVPTCTTKCEDGVTAALKKRRSDVVSAAATCFEASDCRQVLGGERLDECLDEAAVSIAPSPAVKTFCDGLVKAFDRCESHIGRADCLGSMKVYSDPTLAQAETCLEKSCSQMATCVQTTFGFSSR